VFVPRLVKGADIRGGWRITISSGETIPTNLYVVAGEMENDSMAGGELLLKGVLERNLKVADGTVTISGSIQSPAVVRSDQFTIGKQAKLESSPDYFSPRATEIPDSAQIAGPVGFHVTAGMDQRWIGCFLFPKTSTEVAQYTLGNFWKELLRGFVLFFVIPPAFFLQMLSVMDVPMAFLGGLLHLGFGVVVIIYAAGALGAFLMKRFARSESYVADWKAVLGGIYECFWLAIQWERQKEATG
jgi:hypothetical protein